jgi:hypothetical protein
MPGSHADTMINVWINDCGPSLYGSGESDLIMKTWYKHNSQQTMKMRPRSGDTCLTECTHHDVWTKHGEPGLYGSGESNLIMKSWHQYNKASRPWKWGQCLDKEKLLYSVLHRL